MTTTKQETLASIAKDTLGFETLETRNSDGADFRDVAVWTAKAALEAAYDAGRAQRTIYKAELHTRNFHFEALGDSVENARGALIAGLIKHGQQYRIKADWWSEYVEDLTVVEFELNAPALRDREEIVGKNGKSRVITHPR
ncbi:hypothetical protein NLM33_32920 [Bradyrhizobium sp. CCGUVB1N3]|uniref:DUF6900 domain-containing protein n=1 Tax=Bradyrhizobium sp. CCGUVB1N3 TaxID=2949629 RepID=UPI0020B32FBC|nr:hypothetical protein [Bradyrhizobium sp. CCGUVB1N3]MCP3475128.1 hypothetical protein [Bradyrhizobium sp. CCGUVB1N3]